MLGICGFHIRGFSQPWVESCVDFGRSGTLSIEGPLYCTPFYTRDLSVHGFWCLWLSWNQAPADTARGLCIISDYNVAFTLTLLFLTKAVRNLIICAGNENIPLLVARLEHKFLWYKNDISHFCGLVKNK